MDIIDIVVFVLALHTTVGADGKPGEVPLEYGTQVYQAAVHHNVDPVEMGALLLAENKSRKYNPETVGRYGKGGEAGLFQLVKVWGKEATRRCSFTKSRYQDQDLPDCRVIPREVTVHYQCEDDDEDCLDLFDASINIEAAAIAIKYMQTQHAKHHQRKGGDWDWRTHYRCGPSQNARYSRRCQKSVGRVIKWERRVRKQIESYYVILSPVTELISVADESFQFALRLTPSYRQEQLAAVEMILEAAAQD